jgi:hypothetical protein
MAHAARLVRVTSRSLRPTPRVLIAVALACAAGALAHGQTPMNPAQGNALPISSITLYRSGVGYFERLGSVDGDASISLRFATDQVNDILKSMVVLDLGGGSIESVRYGSQEPLERRLASFAIDVSEAPSLELLLGQLRGAPVRISTPEGPVEGTVMGVESRTEQIDRVTIRRPFVNLLTTGGLRSIGLYDASNLQITDPALAAELAKALGALAEHRADNTKSVDLALKGQGDREIFVSYIHEMPVWKASYRLVLPGREKSESADDRPMLQGWAIVENNTDEDWQGVNLSLVAGQPVSFTMNLYQPLYVQRPDVPVPVAAGVAPRNYEAAFGAVGGQSPFQNADSVDDKAPEFDVGEAMKAAPGSSARAKRMVDRGVSAGRDYTSFGVDALREQAGSAVASGTESGEVFMYRLDAPVTVERRQSALLPILSSPIEGERISIYSAADGPKHPMRGVRLVNSTGLQLMPGPIAVYDGASYAGDATISHVPSGDARLLAYAVDLEVDASTTRSPSTRSVGMKLVNGALVMTHEREERIEHTFTNKDTDLDRTVLVEHPRVGGWTLVTPEKPDETTDSLYRFRVGVAPGKPATLAIVQRSIDRQEIAVGEIDLDTMLQYQKQGRASQAIIDAFREAARLRDLVTEAERRIEAASREIDAITQDQSRIRENMNGVDRTSQLYARYVQKLDAQETSLETLRKNAAAASADRDTRRAEYENYVRNLNVE